MTRRATRQAGLALVLAAVTACGSTVQQTGALGGGSTGGVAAPSGDGLSIVEGGAPGQTGDPLAPGDPGAVAAPDSAAGSVPGGAGGSGPVPAPGAQGAPAATGGGGGGGAGAPAAAGRRGPGVSDKAVRIGFQYVDVGSGTGGVIGQDVSLGDPVEQAKAVAQHINKNGGMGGRQIELVPFGVPYSGYVNNPQNEYNRVCSYFTQDEKVAAVAVYVPDETLIDCLAKRDVVSVADGYSMDRQVHQRYARHYYAPGSMSQDRGAEVGVNGLQAAGFFQGATIGVLRYDSGVYERAGKSLDAALASKGLRAAETFEISSANTNSATSDVSAAVLRFRSKGITHVLVLDNSGGIATTFMTAAESQGYRPKYGLTTNNAPSAQRQLSPKEQLAGATAVSWWWGDVGPEEDQATPPALPASKDLCLKIMSDAGTDLSGRAAKGSALITCDQLLFLDTLFDKAPVPASEGLEAAADRLGSSYSSTLSYRTTIGPGRHDGATVTRLIRFAAECGCWRYVGPGPSA